MKFLFEAIALSGPDHICYRVYQSAENKYFAEHFDMPGIGWHFYWANGEWVADDPDLQYQAEQLEEEVERKR